MFEKPLQQVTYPICLLCSSNVWSCQSSHGDWNGIISTTIFLYSLIHWPELIQVSSSRSSIYSFVLKLVDLLTIRTTSLLHLCPPPSAPHSVPHTVCLSQQKRFIDIPLPSAFARGGELAACSGALSSFYLTWMPKFCHFGCCHHHCRCRTHVYSLPVSLYVLVCMHL